MQESTTRELPKELEDLGALALDLRWVGSKLAGRIWSRLDAAVWERTRNPYLVLLNAHQERLDEAAQDEELRKEMRYWLDHYHLYLDDPGWFREHHGKAGLGRVAYFSMEFGLSEGLPIYSGGLGILAGDHLKSASDLNVPLVGIGLLYQGGYFRQVLADDGSQLELFPHNDPTTLPVTPVVGEDGRRPRVRLELPGRTLFLRIWRAQVGKIDLYLLDSNDRMNSPWDRAITANLYPTAKEHRLLQEIVLGVGGWTMLEKLGIDVDVCHMNEGHAAFAVLARAYSFSRDHGVPMDVAIRATRAGNVFTTHTPVAAAFDRFSPELIARVMQPMLERSGLSMEELVAMGRRDPRDANEPFNMAFLAMRGSGSINGVSRLHGSVSRSLFGPLFEGWPACEVPVTSITNGIHVPTWDSSPANDLWKMAAPKNRWVEHLEESAAAIEKVPDERLWEFRGESRQVLVDYVRRRLERQVKERGVPEPVAQRARHVLDPNVLTLGFARRFTEYKRPTLLLHDTERLRAMLRHAERPMQLIVAGKSHPNDTYGKALVQKMASFAASEGLDNSVVFLQDYDMAVAEQLVAGVDVWINTPRRPAEACGTSGMKLIVNGGLHLSVLDGWWDEAYAPDLGWALGGSAEHGGTHDTRDAEELYDLLEHQVATEFYDRDATGIPRKWIKRVRTSMTRLTVPFSSERMVREYVEKVYVPAAGAYARRTGDDAKVAVALEAWHDRVAEAWGRLHFGELRMSETADGWQFEIPVYLGDLSADDVAVQLFAEPPAPDAPPVVVPMQKDQPIAGAINGFQFRAKVRTDRPAEHFTPRVIPHHPDALVPLESSRVRWHQGAARLVSASEVVA